MRTVDSIIADTIRLEGGYVNHPNDRGGPTNMGITQRTLASYLKRDVTIDEVRNLTYELAAEIYQAIYFDGPRLNTLPPTIQPFMFDSSVHHGPRNAIRLLQRVLNAAGFGPFTLDGILGPKTQRGVRSASESEGGELLLPALIAERELFFRRIVANDPTQEVFLRGWLNRLEHFK